MMRCGPWFLVLRFMYFTNWGHSTIYGQGLGCRLLRGEWCLIFLGDYLQAVASAPPLQKKKNIPYFYHVSSFWEAWYVIRPEDSMVMHYPHTSFAIKQVSWSEVIYNISRW